MLGWLNCKRDGRSVGEIMNDDPLITQVEALIDGTTLGEIEYLERQEIAIA